MGDHLSRLGLRAWAPPLPRVGRGADGAVVAPCGLQAGHKTWERLRGSCFTRKRGPAQRLKGFDCLRTLRAPRRLDGVLGRRLARRGLEADPALGHAALRRPPAARARPFLPRRHGRRRRVGQALLGLGHGRRDPRDPRAVGLGQLWQVCSALEGTLGDERGGGSGGERRHVVTDDLAARVALRTMATPGLPQHRDTGWVLHHHRPHPWVEVRAMLPTRAVGNVHDLCVRRRRAVLPAIDRQTRRIAMAERGRPSQTRGRRGGHEAGECRHPKGVEGIEGAPEGVIMERARRHAWGNEA